MVMTLVIVAVVAFLLILIYNNLISKRNQVSNAFAGIETLLKKRFDLIPNLIQAVQRYMKHETDLLTQVTELRTTELRTRDAAAALGEAEAVELDRKTTQALGSIMVAVENYPELKASQNFVQLQGSLNEVEEQISAARRAYNASVKDFNNTIEMFPGNLLAGLMGLKPKAFFEITEQERRNIDVGQAFAS